MKNVLTSCAMFLLLCTSAGANTYGSVEPLANPTVLDTSAIRDESLAFRAAFADRLLRCGIVEDVIQVLTLTGGIASVNTLNTRFDLVAGGFQGATNPAYGYTIIDDGPNAASAADIAVLSNALGYVFSQGSVFLLDADDPGSFDFPANYVVINFPSTPALDESAAFFELVGSIDPELFDTDSSGYTQYGIGYLSLQSFVPDQQFIDGYAQAAEAAGLEYTPVVGGEPGLFTGGAAFPGNDWTGSPNGEDYLGRIPDASHAGLADVRDFHLRLTVRWLARLRGLGAEQTQALLENLPCR